MNSLEKRVRKLEIAPSEANDYERYIRVCEQLGIDKEWVRNNGPISNLTEFYAMIEWHRKERK